MQLFFIMGSWNLNQRVYHFHICTTTTTKQKYYEHLKAGYTYVKVGKVLFLLEL